jgi:hypothetical protein
MKYHFYSRWHARRKIIIPGSMNFRKPSPTLCIIRACALIAALALPCVTVADTPRAADLGAESDATLLARLKQYRAEVEALKSQTDAQLAILRQRQEALAKLRLQLAQMGVARQAAPITAPTTAPALAPAPPPATPKASAPEHAPQHTTLPARPAAQEDMPDWQLGLLAAALLALLLLLVRTGLRYARSRTPARAKPGLPAPINGMAAPALATPASPARLTQPAPSAPTASAPIPGVPAVPVSTAQSSVAPTHPLARKEEWYDEASLLDEAQLYVNHGRLVQAVEILEEINQRNPGNAQAWALLLSSYSSLGRTAAFETSAQAFHEQHADNLLWGGIQALGRTLAPNNALYVARNRSGTLVHRPIGDILLELGSLSSEALEICLDEFDPKKDGRLGGYLVKRKIITLAQLDEALLAQQGGNGASADPSPSADDVEKFMADFDPQKHGSMIEYLAARKALSQQQVNNLLQQQAAHPPTF